MRGSLGALGYVCKHWLHSHGLGCICTNYLDPQDNVGNVDYGLYFRQHEIKQSYWQIEFPLSYFY